MNGTAENSFYTSKDEQPGIQQRDSDHARAIQNGIANQLALDNGWDDMLPTDRVMAAIAVTDGKQAQDALYIAYAELPEETIALMVEKRELPVAALNEDTYSSAILALFEAMVEWNPESSSPFRQHARNLIRDAVIANYANDALIGGLPQTHHANRAKIEAANEHDQPEPESLRKRLGLDQDVAILAKGRRPGEADHHSFEEYMGLLDRLGQVGLITTTDLIELEEANPSLVVRMSLRGMDRVKEEQRLIDPELVAERFALRRLVQQALAELSEREQLVVRLRFGLEDGTMRTLEEVAKEFGVARERIRLVESKILARLRNPAHTDILRAMVDPDRE